MWEPEGFFFKQGHDAKKVEEMPQKGKKKWWGLKWD